MRDYMVDVETLSTAPNAAVIQIGANTFDETNPFLAGVAKAEYAGSASFHREQSVIDWWSRQSASARSALSINLQPSVKTLATMFVQYLIRSGFGTTSRIWANPAHFDIPILEHLLRTCGLPVPWMHWQVRCGRTIVEQFGERGHYHDLTKHRADHDCIAQIRDVKRALQHGS